MSSNGSEELNKITNCILKENNKGTLINNF
jgi:hypothetical protein